MISTNKSYSKYKNNALYFFIKLFISISKYKGFIFA